MVHLTHKSSVVLEQCSHTKATLELSKMKNLISLIAGSGILVLASAAVPYSHSHSFKPQSCRSYTLDRCEFSADILHTTTLDVDDVFCQTLCDVLYGSDCKYFVYDYPQRQCDIYGTKHDPTFKTLCAEHGGPVLPTIGHCEASDDPCIVSTLFLSFKCFVLVVPYACIHRTSNMQTATTGLIPSRLTPHLLMKRAVSSFVKRTRNHVFITFTKKGNPNQSVSYLLMKKEHVIS